MFVSYKTPPHDAVEAIVKKGAIAQLTVLQGVLGALELRDVLPDGKVPRNIAMSIP